MTSVVESVLQWKTDWGDGEREVFYVRNLETEHKARTQRSVHSCRMINKQKGNIPQWIQLIVNTEISMSPNLPYYQPELCLQIMLAK